MPVISCALNLLKYVPPVFAFVFVPIYDLGILRIYAARCRPKPTLLVLLIQASIILIVVLKIIIIII